MIIAQVKTPSAPYQAHKIKRAKRVLGTLARKHRVDIINLLQNNHELTVTDIYIRLRQEQSEISQALADLKSIGIVRGERRGKNIYYSIRHNRVQRLMVIVRELADMRTFT